MADTDTRAISWPVTPVIPPTVVPGAKITSSQTNSEVKCLGDLWTNLQAVGNVAVTDPTTTKGDMLARSSAALTRLAVGVDGTVLMADASATTGMRWATYTQASLVPAARRVNTGAGLKGGGALTADLTLTADVVTVFGRTGNVVLTAADISGAGGVPATRQVKAGAGMTGGGALSADVTLNANVLTVLGRTGDVTIYTSDLIAAGAVTTTRRINTSTGLSGGGDLSADLLLAVVPDSTVQQVRVSNAGALMGTRRELNFIAGANVGISAADNPSQNRVDITIVSTGGGGSGGGSQTPWIQDVDAFRYSLLNASYVETTFNAGLTGNLHFASPDWHYINDGPGFVLRADGATGRVALLTALTGIGGNTTTLQTALSVQGQQVYLNGPLTFSDSTTQNTAAAPQTPWRQAIDAAGYALSNAGLIESKTGGFKFPDGSTQTSAAVSATGTPNPTPNTLVQRDSAGAFSAAGSIQLEGPYVSRPTAKSDPTINTELGSLRFQGWLGGASTARRAGLLAYAAENWTTSATGAYVAVETTAIGSVTQREVARFSAAGHLMVGTTSDDGNMVQVNGTIKSLTGGFIFPDGTVQTTKAVLTPWTSDVQASGWALYGAAALHIGFTSWQGWRLAVKEPTGNLPDPAGSVFQMLQLLVTDPNTDRIEVFVNRDTAAGAWDNCSWYIRRAVDATQLGYIRFAPTAITMGMGAAQLLYMSTTINVIKKQLDIDMTAEAQTYNWSQAPIRIDCLGARIAFDHPGVASQIGIEYANTNTKSPYGCIRTFDNPGTGWENFAANHVYAQNDLVFGRYIVGPSGTQYTIQGDQVAPTANQLLRQSSNGYTYTGWINTASGDNGTTAITRVYASMDPFIRYYTPFNFASQMEFCGGLWWRSYTAGQHRIVDVSTGFTPGGRAVSNTNAETPWQTSYPLLVGYNGTNTFGVRVDSSRWADSADYNQLANKPDVIVNNRSAATSLAAINGSNIFASGQVQFGVYVLDNAGSSGGTSGLARIWVGATEIMYFLKEGMGTRSGRLFLSAPSFAGSYANDGAANNAGLIRGDVYVRSDGVVCAKL